MHDYIDLNVHVVNYDSNITGKRETAALIVKDGLLEAMLPQKNL